MNTKALEEAASLARHVGHVLLATADEMSLPHVAAARIMSIRKGNVLSVTEWFCPGTLANLEINRRVSLVVWDAAVDQGYQLLGEVERVEDLAIMDGFDPTTPQATLPQVQRRLIVRVDTVLDFTLAPHSDVEE